MLDEFKDVTITPVTFLQRGHGSICKSHRSLKVYPNLGQEFITTSETHTLKHKDEIETNLDKAVEPIQSFLNPTCKEISQGNLTAQDV